jgi:hypothetical protein
LLILASIFIFSDSEELIFKISSSRSLFFVSIVVLNVPRDPLRISTVALRRIAFVRSEILDPKSSDIHAPLGSKSSPSTDTARYPCFDRIYAAVGPLTTKVLPNMKLLNSLKSEYTKSAKLPIMLTSS